LNISHNAISIFQRPGDCRCKPGFGGRRCDRCALGFRNHPICEPCPCHQAGSLNFETCEEEHCICKSNVEGEKCDRCKPGTIYLEKDNPLGCQQCFCFGKSNECREFPWNTGHVNLLGLGIYWKGNEIKNGPKIKIFLDFF
jgi:laminin, alpha 1/2